MYVLAGGVKKERMNKLASVQLGDDEEGGGAREDMRAGRKEGSAQGGAILENHT